MGESARDRTVNKACLLAFEELTNASSLRAGLSDLGT